MNVLDNFYEPTPGSSLIVVFLCGLMVFVIVYAYGYAAWRSLKKTLSKPKAGGSPPNDKVGSGDLTPQEAARAFGAARASEAVDEEQQRLAALRNRKSHAAPEDSLPGGEATSHPLVEDSPFLVTVNGNKPTSVRYRKLSDAAIAADEALKVASTESVEVRNCLTDIVVDSQKNRDFEGPKDQEGGIADILASELA